MRLAYVCVGVGMGLIFGLDHKNFTPVNSKLDDYLQKITKKLFFITYRFLKNCKNDLKKYIYFTLVP